jgi:hypothetical protein
MTVDEAFYFPLGLNNNNNNNFTTQQCRSCLDHKWAVTIQLRIKELKQLKLNC